MMAKAGVRFSKIGLAAVVALMLAACGGSAPETFDLSSAPASPAHRLRTQLSVREPITSLDLDSQRILVRTGPETVAYLSGAQWSDRLPVLVQTRLVQTFQNALASQSVARAGTGIQANYSLDLDIRAFELDAKAVEANVDIAAKIIDMRNGRVVASRIFKTRAPAAGTSGAKASAALNAALTSVMTEIVDFASTQI
jgi:cholesterol transport system auxiliary component